jgi:predicted amidohydrolase YtcJ
MVVAERENVLAPDLEKHRGQWVAIKDGQIVAFGQSAVDVVRHLRERKIVGAALHRVAETPNAALVL